MRAQVSAAIAQGGAMFAQTIGDYVSQIPQSTTIPVWERTMSYHPGHVQPTYMSGTSAQAQEWRMPNMDSGTTAPIMFPRTQQIFQQILF